MPRRNRTSGAKATKLSNAQTKESKYKAILVDFDNKVASRLEQLDENTKEYCDEITDAFKSMLVRIPKNHQDMLILDYIDMKNKANELMNSQMDISDEVFENLPGQIKKATPIYEKPSTSSSSSRQLRFLKPSTLKRKPRNKSSKMTASDDNLANIAGSRSARSRSTKRRSQSESRASSRVRTASAAAAAKRTTPLPGTPLSGAFSAIRSQSQRRTPNATPLRKCRAGERCIILSESGSPLSGGAEPTIMCPVKDGAMIALSARNIDHLDEDTRENLMIIHSKLSALLDRN